MMIHENKDIACNSGYPSNIEPHLSAEQASQEIGSQAGREIDALINAIKMQNPVSHSSMTALVEKLVRETVANDVDAIAKAMQTMGWEAHLGKEENLRDLAMRLADYFSQEPGVGLLDRFIRSIAQTSGKMY